MTAKDVNLDMTLRRTQAQEQEKGWTPSEAREALEPQGVGGCSVGELHMTMLPYPILAGIHIRVMVPGS